jgi:DnaA family protein
MVRFALAMPVVTSLPDSPHHQQPLALITAPSGRFDTFLAGPNAPAAAQLAADVPPTVPQYLWGESGCGKTHLLQAVVHHAGELGLACGWFDAQTPLPWTYGESWALIVLDDANRFDASRQAAAFALCVEAQAHGRPWLASGDCPPTDLRLRDDLRTRLGWGQVHQLRALDDEQVIEALGQESDRRGLPLSADVVRYLQRHCARDLASLMALLDALDRYSLARGRALTVPLLREWLMQRQDVGGQA